MSDSGPSDRLRRPPPPFRRLMVKTCEQLTPHMVGLTLYGPELAGFPEPEPGASVRLLIPSRLGDDLVMPEWNGNEFLAPGGHRPIIRTFTPRRYRTDEPELDLEVVLHEGGAVSDWVAAAGSGDPAAISGPGRGYSIDSDATDFVLAGDETAIPAIAQLLEILPHNKPARISIEVRHRDARIPLPEHRNARVDWLLAGTPGPPGRALIAAVRELQPDPGTRLWVAGEAAAMHQVRRYLFKELELPRTQATVRGYWKKRD